MDIEFMRNTFIYALKDLNGDIRYVGKSDTPVSRLRSHWNDSRKSKSLLGEWLRTLPCPPEIEVIAEIPFSMWEEYEREAIYIFRYGGAKLVNSTDGGEAGPSTKGRKVSKETRKILSQKMSGKNNHQFGREYSLEEREERRIRSAGPSNPFWGRQHTLETKAQISKSKKGQGLGKPLSAEHREKLSKSRIGRTVSEETRSKIRKTLTGRKGLRPTEETREKLRAAWVRRKALKGN